MYECVKDSLSGEEKMNGTSMCGVWLLHVLLMDQLLRHHLVIVMREKGSMVLRGVKWGMQRCMQRGMQWGISGRVNCGGGDEGSMVSNGGLVVSRSMGQEWRVVSSVWCIVSMISDQRSWRIDGSVQCWCSNHWCHDACHILNLSVKSLKQLFERPHLAC